MASQHKRKERGITIWYKELITSKERQCVRDELYGYYEVMPSISPIEACHALMDQEREPEYNEWSTSFRHEPSGKRVKVITSIEY